MSEACEPAGPSTPPDVMLGVVADPSVADALTPQLVDDLRRELAAQHPAVRWQLTVRTDVLVQPPAADSEIVRAARERLLTHGWDLLLVLTDLPLRVARRPVVAHASPVHRVGVLSVPALGPVGVRRRARDALLRLVDALLGEAPDADRDGTGETAARSRRMGHRLREVAAEVDEQADAIRFTARVLTGHLRLLVGMVRANRPWQLALHLTRALTAAGAAGVLALVTSDIWRLADAAGWIRLTAVMIASVAAIGATLIVGARLWEHADRPQNRQQVVLFNLATTATIAIGVLALFAALDVLALVAAVPLLVPSLLSAAIHHPAAFSDYAEVAWLTASLGTVGGALGAGLESDEAVRRAAYTYRTSDRTEAAAS